MARSALKCYILYPVDGEERTAHQDIPMVSALWSRSLILVIY